MRWIAATTMALTLGLGGAQASAAQELTVADLTPNYYGCHIWVDWPGHTTDWNGFLKRRTYPDSTHTRLWLEDGRDRIWLNGRLVNRFECIGSPPQA